MSALVTGGDWYATIHKITYRRPFDPDPGEPDIEITYEARVRVAFWDVGTTPPTPLFKSGGGSFAPLPPAGYVFVEYRHWKHLSDPERAHDCLDGLP
jgi:hypothetical protein